MKQTIVYIITKLELGGAQKVCLSLFTELQKKNTQTFLITGTQGTLIEQVQALPNVFLIPTLQREVGFKGIINEIRAFFTLIKILKNLKKNYPHISVHTHSTKAGIIGRWAAFFVGIKKRIHTIHGFAFHEHQPRIIWWPIFLAEWFTCFITTRFVCVSSHDIKLGKKLFPNFAKKHLMIRAAVEQKQFYIPARKTELRPTNTFVFGTVSCFKPQKNLFDLLHAFNQVHKNNSNTRLEIIGDGTLRPKIEQWIIHHNLETHIVLHGWQKQVAPTMLAWHAFTLTSLWEGLPCTIVEARLLRLPVISYKTGGITDIIQHEKNGLLVDQKNWQHFALEMERLLYNTSLYETLKNTTESWHEFSYDHMAQQHIQLYRQLHTPEVQ